MNDLGKNEVIVHQYGGRAGGPIVLPGMFDGRGKAFFFFNFEHLYQPTSATRTRTFLRDSAHGGDLPLHRGRRDADGRPDGAGRRHRPHVDVRSDDRRRCCRRFGAATLTTGKVNDLEAANTLQYVFQSPSIGNQYSPTQRVDVNLSHAAPAERRLLAAAVHEHCRTC